MSHSIEINVGTVRIVIEPYAVARQHGSDVILWRETDIDDAVSQVKAAIKASIESQTEAQIV